MLTPSILNYMLTAFQQCQITLSDLILTVLVNKNLEHHPLLDDLARNIAQVLAALLHNTRTSEQMQQWAHHAMKIRCHRAARKLTRAENGWHFSALRMTANQVREFRIEDMAVQMVGAIEMMSFSSFRSSCAFA